MNGEAPKGIFLTIFLRLKAMTLQFTPWPRRECQYLASRFEENARKDLAGMMDLYEKTTYDIQRYIQWPEINFKENHPVPITVFEEIEKDFERVKEEVKEKKE